MSKVLWIVIVSLFCLSSLSLGLTALEQKQNELNEVSDYIQQLDSRIVETRAQKQINKLAELKELKRLALLRAQKLKAEIAQPAPSEPKTEQAGQARDRSWRRQADLKVDYIKGWVGAMGFSGGGAAVELGYPFGFRGFPLIGNMGLGVGNGYTFLKFGIFKTIPIRNYYVGGEVDLISYSQSVSAVPGVAGTVDSGGRLALGVFSGMEVGDFDAQIGYNSALGINLKLVYGF